MSAPVEDPPAPRRGAMPAIARARMRAVSCSCTGISSPWYTHTFTPMIPNVVLASAVP